MLGESESLKVGKADILQYQMGSDHCPIYIEFTKAIPLPPEHPPAKLSSDTIKVQKVSRNLCSSPFHQTNKIAAKKNIIRLFRKSTAAAHKETKSVNKNCVYRFIDFQKGSESREMY